MNRSISLKITGKVQNVGFRYYTRKKAQSLNLTGFVRNLPDGSVYAEASGPKNDMDVFIDYCRKGPDWSIVDSIVIQDIPLQEFDGFSIR